MSKVVSLRLKDDQVERLERAARRLGRSPSGAAVLLLEEALRQRDFPFIEFRDTVLGRQAYVKGTRLAAWQVKWLAGHYGGDLAEMASSLGVPDVHLAAALRYAEAYPEEVEAAIADNSRTPEELRRFIPNLEVVAIRADPA